MQKMSCLFKRDFSDPRRPVLLREVSLGCEWVLDGAGTASRKWDGTACAVIGGHLYKRYDAKRDRATGAYKKAPEGAVACCEPDPVTGHWPHWVPVVCGEPADKWHIEVKRALLDAKYTLQEIKESVLSGERLDWLPDGTYELVGPPIGGNRDRREALELRRHGDVVVDLRALGALFHDGAVDVGAAFDYFRTWLAVNTWEG